MQTAEVTRGLFSFFSLQAGFDFLDLEVVLPSISLLGVGLELGNY